MNNNEMYLTLKNCPKKAISARAKEMADKGENHSKEEIAQLLQSAMSGKEKKSP